MEYNIIITATFSRKSAKEESSWTLTSFLLRQNSPLSHQGLTIRMRGAICRDYQAFYAPESKEATFTFSASGSSSSKIMTRDGREAFGKPDDRRMP